MSAETDFRALLAGFAGLVALVGQRVSENAVPEGEPRPYVAFTSRHELTHNLLSEVMADQCTFTVQCWADNASQAAAVAEQVLLAVAEADPAHGAVVLSTDSAYDPAAGADAAILTVEWWAL